MTGSTTPHPSVKLGNPHKIGYTKQVNFAREIELGFIEGHNG